MVHPKHRCHVLWHRYDPITAGQGRFSVITGNYYRGCDVFVIVYDATNRTSCDHVDARLTQIQQYRDMQHGVILICANKADLVSEVVVSERDERAKGDMVGALFVPTSARTGRNVDFALLTATERIVEIRKLKLEDKRTRTLEFVSRQECRKSSI
jgi:GTPase SAR1 family protein